MAAALALAGSAAAAAPSGAALQVHAIDRFHQAVWSTQEGFPGEVQSVARTPDGYLWLGTGNGLLRFDGVAFRNFAEIAAPGQALLSPTVSSVDATADGDLWIGYTFGGVSRLHRGRLTHFPYSAGLPRTNVDGVVRDRAGTIWAATGDGLYRLRGDAFEPAGERLGLPARERCSMPVFDGDGALWVAESDAVYVLEPGADRFTRLMFPMPASGVTPRLFAGPDGRIWAAVDDPVGDRGHAGPMEAVGEPASAVRARWHAVPDVTKPLTLADGTILFASGEGVGSLDPGGQVGMAGQHDLVFSLSVDREGTVWAAGKHGLQSFRPGKFQVIPLRRELTAATIPSDQRDAVWVPGPDESVERIHPDGRRELLRISGGHEAFTALHRARDGSLWAADIDGVHHWIDGRDVKLPMPQNVGPTAGGSTDDAIVALATDATGAPWLSVMGKGLYRFADGRWSRWAGRKDLPHLLPLAMTRDAQGRLWLGYPDDVVLRIDGVDAPAVRIPGLHVGTVLSIFAADDRTWIGGDLGAAFVDARGTHAFVVRDKANFVHVSGIVQTAAGDVWFNGPASIQQARASDIARQAADPGHAIELRRFDNFDGNPGPPEGVMGLPTVQQSDDHRLWFPQAVSMLTLDADRIAVNRVPPPVAIETVEAGGRRYPAGSAVVLPPGTTELAIEYAGLSLAVAQRTRFRYWLEGQDDGWRPETAGRRVTWTNLKPGKYRFHLMAANDDGVWSTADTSLAITLEPTFFQTRWFAALCALAVLASGWLFVQWRIREGQRRLQLRQDARLRERERIARELHDTLLQSAHGLIMVLQARLDRLTLQEADRAALDKAVERATDLVTEGRDRIYDLRTPPASTDDFFASLKESGEALDLDGDRFRAVSTGRERVMEHGVREEAQRIVGEALANAFRHSQARTIRLLVDVGDRALTLCVIDDGIGLAKEDAATSRDAAGHWGITGMRERARRIGARLDIDSDPRRGTQVRLRIAASRVFGARSWRQRWSAILRGRRARVDA